MDANINKAVIDKQTKIYVAGHRGLVGSAIVRNLEGKGYTHIVTQTRLELDLMDTAAVNRFFETEKPEVVIDAAAKVGGIYANNTYPAEFIYSNLCIQNNLIHGAYQAGVKKFVFLGSSCIYPKMAPQPLKEEYLLTGPLEPTNEWYAVAKIAGIKMCQAYRKQYGFDAISLMPTNLYGPGDNFDLQNSHVLPALIRKFHEAKQSNAESVVIWGTGTPMREFLYVDDMADASVYLMENYSDLEIVNVGTGQDVTIRELAETIQKVVGFAGKLEFDTTKPDGTMRKLLDVSKLSAEGWQAKVPLEQGITQLYDWYQKNLA
ncbi:GDP-L-fucose synthase [Methylicorpusculum sp.]|uniref:GDP-L-fucose synthase n=1 Tax=Methylicorpusculum sp. TaxID=2713644 RepID=UPI0027192D4C|nr:GDP-L-fucose synthase [Methylicorpusculum sp.]MDO8844256.1 GDP-L-fucose synthase [Methylicorpusculum sp.]MDP3531479.1 GDP-L-fucose synthase [Methylicorpusculum sp.]MDZ4152763.1 GDP-L-fucose synthase [Methylicorpusculum sp.]